MRLEAREVNKNETGVGSNLSNEAKTKLVYSETESYSFYSTGHIVWPTGKKTVIQKD